jgi:hypothetical protein
MSKRVFAVVSTESCANSFLPMRVNFGGKGGRAAVSTTVLTGMLVGQAAFRKHL